MRVRYGCTPTVLMLLIFSGLPIWCPGKCSPCVWQPAGSGSGSCSGSDFGSPCLNCEHTRAWKEVAPVGNFTRECQPRIMSCQERPLSSTDIASPGKVTLGSTDGPALEGCISCPPARPHIEFPLTCRGNPAESEQRLISSLGQGLPTITKEAYLGGEHGSPAASRCQLGFEPHSRTARFGFHLLADSTVGQLNSKPEVNCTSLEIPVAMPAAEPYGRTEDKRCSTAVSPFVTSRLRSG